VPPTREEVGGGMNQTQATAPLGNHRLTLEKIPAKTDSPATWGDMVAEWREYLREKKTQNLVFVGQGEDNANEIRVAPYSHRFQQEYTEMQYAKIQDFIRGALSEYTDPHLVFLTFSTSTTTPTGDPRPPIDHMNEVVDTWGNGVYYELNQVMDGSRKSDPWEPREKWEYLYILEPTTNKGHMPGGYAHAHAALVVDGEIDGRRFESVVDRHLVEAPNATAQAHEFEDAIEVKQAEELGNPGAYMFKYLGKSWDVSGMADYEERFAALLFDQGRQRFRASNGAQRWLQRDEDDSESGDWMFAGVASDEQAEELRDYEDYEDFLVATGPNVTGLRTYLQEEDAKRRADQEKERRREKARVSRQEMDARIRAGIPMPWEGDRPPP